MYALGTYEIELINSQDLDLIIDYSYNKMGIQYIDTAISYNNDYLIGNKFKDFKIISKISPLMNLFYDNFIDNHLKFLKKESIDIMLIHNNRSHWLDLAKRMLQDKRLNEVGVSNFEIEDLELWKNEFGIYPKYNEIEINPYFYKSKLISFCREKGIKIIAYAILGGKYNAIKNIRYLTLPVLIEFVNQLADIIILRPDSFTQLVEMHNSFYLVHSINWTNVFINYESQKSVEPTKYTPSSFIGGIQLFDAYSIPTYDKFGFGRLIKLKDYSSDAISIIKVGYANKKFQKFYEEFFKKIEGIQSVNFEFITEYRVYIRYLLNDLFNQFKYENLNFDYVNDILVIKEKDELLFAVQVYIQSDELLDKVKTPNNELKVICLGRLSTVENL